MAAETSPTLHAVLQNHVPKNTGWRLFLQTIIARSYPRIIGQQRDKLNQITDKQIRYMGELAAHAPEDDPQKPDYLFRLGELLADKHRLLTFGARALD